MAEKKQKKAKAEKKSRKSFLSKTRTLDPKKKKGKKNSSKSERKRGPELPSSLRKELNRLNPNPRSPDAGSGSDSDAAEPERPADLYEYVEPLPQEESKKNRRFDPVDNYEFELPEDFKDENIPSDDDEEELPSDDDDDDDGDRHLRMLEGVTGMPGEAFEGKKRKNVVFSDELIGNYPEITIEDLLDDYPGLPGYSKLRKRMLPEHQSVPLQAPLPTVEQQRIERKVTYEKSKKNITKWEPLVKRNRELPTLYFQEDVNLGFSTVGAIASEFEPRTEFEKKMAMLVRDPEITEAHWKDGAKLLELNKIPVEDVRDRHNRLAKMRSLLFRHEMKAKHIKKIKSKTYHRILKKEKLKTASAEMQMDPEAAKEYAMKQEFKRAEERLTLKHKNSSKWARRILTRGLSVQDEGTQAAISEQLHQHALLTRKMNSMRDSDNSGTDDSSDDDVDELSHATKTGGVSMILNRAKEKTIEVIEEEDEIPKSGVLALPFMERGLRKQKEAAYEEARLAIQEFNSSLRQLEDGNEAECPTSDKTSGRKVFGADREKSKKSNSRTKSENIGNNSDTEDELEDKEHEDVIHEAAPLEDVNIRWALQDESQMGQEPIYKSFEDIVKNPGPKTTHEVAIFVSDSWKMMKGENEVDGRARETTAAGNPVLPRCDLKGTEQNSDSESDEDMVDGFLSSGAKLDYELPSQADLVHRAFAGDDVEAEFEKDKMAVLNEENPEPEKPKLVPGWGQWTHIQQKKGMPSRMLDEHEKAKRKREEALHKRKDAQLKHVIISEKIDRKAEKLHAKTLPFPYTSKEVYEQSIRMPIGPEYNPAISVGALNRPAVVKKAGVIIKPIKYEDVDPYEREDEPKRSRQKQKTKTTKSAGGKTVKKASGEKRS